MRKIHSAMAQPAPPRISPPTRAIATAVWIAAEISLLLSPSPMYRATTTFTPTAMPISRFTTRFTMAVVLPTAARLA